MNNNSLVFIDRGYARIDNPQVSPESLRDKVSSKHIKAFAAITRRLIHDSKLFSREGAIVEVLVNPASGLLKWGPAHRRMMRHLQRLADARTSGNQPRENLEVRFHETESRSDAGEKAAELVRNMVASEQPGKRLLILAGGDGFHNDVCTALLNAVPEIMSGVVLYRLPMGTGNDNADAATVEEAFARLGSADSVHQDSLVSITTARKAQHYAFNVASFGLDAFVCELTNRMKTLAGPRIIYKIFADVAVLVYEWIWPLKNWDIVIRTGANADSETRRSGRFLLTIFGRKGDTRYGGGMKVLPGDENFLLVRPLALLGKMRIKPLFYRGAHRGLPMCEFYKTDEITVTHHGRILMEIDGEVVRLEEDDFPVRLVRVPNVLTILK